MLWKRRTVNLIVHSDSCHLYLHSKYRREMFIIFTTLFLIFSPLCIECGSKSIKSVDLRKTKIWGPGLDPVNVVLPVRHFYIMPIDDFGYAFNASLPEKIHVDIIGDSKTGKCRVRLEQLDKRDGSYIVRYKVFGSCWNFAIHVMYKSKHVSSSPYLFSGIVRSEKCRCPQPIDQWLAHHMCDTTYQQIENDLKPFKRINFNEMRSRILSKYNRPGSVSLCNYVIVNNHVYRKCHGQHTGFKMFPDALLSLLVSIVKLPNVEFILNLGDYPLVKKGGVTRTHGPFPIFSWCGSDDTFDIVLPTYDITESSIEMMSRVSIDILAVQNAKTSWSEKQSMAFWRGRDARRERLQLIEIARKSPSIINASLTNFFFFRDEENKYGPKTAHISFFEFFDYKYQINIDGTVAAYRFPYLLASNSVVFKQESPFYEHFYKQLSAMDHYIPVKRDLSNLVKQIEWAMHNDDYVKRVSKNAQAFVNEHLSPGKILCYHVTLLKEWSQRLVNDIQAQSDMELLQEENNDCDCIKSMTSTHDEL